MTEATAPATAGLTHPANVLTIGRLLLAPALFWLVLTAEDTRGVSWAAFALGWLMGLSDFLDGRLARRSGVSSSTGAFLDPLADKVVVIGSAVCLVAVDRYWWVPVALVTVRELGITAWRMRLAREGLSVPARRSAKYKTLVQGLALAVAVFPPAEDADAVVAGAWWVATVWTVVTGVQYVIDGRAAAGRA